MAPHEAGERQGQLREARTWSTERLGRCVRRSRIVAEQGDVGGFGRRRGAHTQLLDQEPAATLVGPQRLSPVPGAGVGIHQPDVGRLPERLQGDGLLGRPYRARPVPVRQAGGGQRIQGAEVDLPKLGLALFHPGSRHSRQELARRDGDSLAGRLPRPARIALPQGAFSVDDRRRRRLDVDDGTGREVHLVAPEPGGEQLYRRKAGPREQRPQLAHQYPQ